MVLEAIRDSARVRAVVDGETAGDPVVLENPVQLVDVLVPDHLQKSIVADIERGLASDILQHPWQSETCIGNWHYLRRLYEMPGDFGGYMNPQDVIHWLVDTVSKNGTFILNVPGKPDGTIVYAILLGWPEEPVLIRSLGSAAATWPGTVSQVELLGTQARPKWQQTAEGLRLDLSSLSPAADYAAALRIHIGD